MPHAPLRRFGLLLAGLLFSAAAAASEWTTDPASSQLRFIGGYMGEDFEGVFNRFSPQIRFDAESLEGRFEVAIELASADTGDEEWDDYLQGRHFFDVRRFPQAHYRAERFERRGEGFVALGSLELRGVSLPVELEFSWVQDGDTATLEGGAELDRLAFEVGGGDWADPDTIGHRVEVRTRLALKR